MPPNGRYAPWTEDEVLGLRGLCQSVRGNIAIARELNARYHGGRLVRTSNAVSVKRALLDLPNTAPRPTENPRAEPPPAAVLPVTEQRVEREESDGGVTLKSVGQRIKTVDELLAHAAIDLTRYEVARQKANTWDTTLCNSDGTIRTVQNFQIWVEVRPKAGPNVEEQVGAVIAGAFAARRPLAMPRIASGNRDVLQGIVINDVHVGKLAWGDSTGGPHYDTGLAVDTLRQGVAHLMGEGRARGIGVRHFWLLGDYFHHDGQGTTSSGTVMEYDSRLQKMLRDGTAALCDVIAASAAQVPTTVTIVPGNHDRVLTWALQRILVAEFRRHKGVTIDEGYTSTKYLRHGKCLIGLDHGDRGKKRLAASMAHACAVEWGETICREIHTGHLHTKRRTASETDTIDGVTIYTHNALCPADQYHADEKFDTSPRTIEAFRYHAGGMCMGSDAWSPDLHGAPRSGLKRVA